MSIIKLDKTHVTDFNKETLAELKPYFDTNLCVEQRELLLQNLLTLAQHNLSIAHCLQHHITARAILETAFADKPKPKFYQSSFENQIGCWSTYKSKDCVIDNNVVSGVKHWVSNLHQADFAIFGIAKVENYDEHAYVLFDLTKNQYRVDLSMPDQIGMEIARGGSLIIDNYVIPQDYLLGARTGTYIKGTDTFKSITIDWHDYAFLTNYLGLAIGLLNDLRQYVNEKQLQNFNQMRQVEMRVNTLKMLWEKNITYVPHKDVDFYIHRKVQYAQSKEVLLELINVILQVGDSSWLGFVDEKSQRFRDALVFSTHMGGLSKWV